MRVDKNSFDSLIVPLDEIGWSDESFDLALRYVLHTTNLAEVSDMQTWLQNHIAKDIFWAMGQQMTRSIFKRPMLETFKSFNPSVMQDAYNEIKQNPRPGLEARNAAYALWNVVLVVAVLVAVGFLIKSILLKAI